ncbi:extracellular matrix regulator RemB [Marinicrinis sediminis]|uniref:Extracellular matrix regulator RemB n=1 Tax=Marinicrinis sediminis TaxID=1652465 RepID=A0ABW5RAY3_9BACL
MFIHLGGEKVIRASELIGIFDLSIEDVSKISKQFIQQAHANKKVETIGEESPKSMVIAMDKIYYSPISSATLKKRAKHLLTHLS